MRQKLNLLLLGPPEIRLGPELFQVQPGAARALLYCLASRGDTIRREELFPLFWNNEPKTAARQHLGQTLDALRSALPVPGLILDQGDLIGLDSTRSVVDQQVFLDLIDQAGRDPWQNPAQKLLSEKSVELLQRAASLWRSTKYLDGADFLDQPSLSAWLHQTGQRLEHQFARVARRLSEHAHATGDLDHALKLIQAALQIDRLNEELHARVMQILIEKGRLDEANQYFDGLQELFRRELGTSPSPRLVAFYRQIRDHRDAVTHPRQVIDWKIRTSVKAPFVGRQQILGHLDRAFRRGGGLWVLGEAGQGKTRLLQEFTARLEPQTRLLVATCRPAEKNLPFHPLMDIFRRQLLPEEWLSLPARWANQITRLIPEIVSMRPDLEQPAFEAEPHEAPEQLREVLLEAVRQVLLGLAEDRRMILCLDDIQWSDEATLAAVRYLLERPPFDQRALLLLAARTGESSPHLETALWRARDSDLIQIIQLPRLSNEDIVELAQFVTGQTPSKQLTMSLAAETGGNPYFLLETLRALFEQAAQTESAGSQVRHIPGSIRALIDNRLNQLAPSARRILEAAAILGTDFDLELLSQVSQQPRSRVEQAVWEMVERMLVEPLNVQIAEARYRLAHDILREILIQEISPIQKRLLYGRAARALESSYSTAAQRSSKARTADRAAVLAYFFENAGERVRAFDYWVQAGQRARQLLSTAEATAAFSAAEKTLLANPDLSDNQIHDLYAEWSEMAYENEDAGTIRRINTRLIEIGEERGSPLLIGTGLDGLSDAFMVGNQFEEGLEHVNQAIPYLEQGGNLFEQMEAYNHRGTFLYMLNRIEEAIESFQDALALGSASQEALVVRARANAHFQIAVALTLNGWPRTAVSHAVRSLTDFRAAKHPHGQAIAYNALALARYFLGEYRQALADCQLGTDIAEQLHAWRNLGYQHVCRSMIELATGNLDAAVAHAELAIQLGQRYGHAEIAAGGYRMLGDLYAWMHLDVKAVEFYRLGLDSGQEHFMGVDQMFRMGLSLARSGQVKTGLYWQEQAHTIAKRTGLGIIQIMANLAGVLISQIQGELELSNDMATELYQDAIRRSIPSIRLYASIALAEIAIQRDQAPVALDLLIPAAQEAALLPQPWIELTLQAQLDRAQRLAHQPDPAPRLRIRAILDRIEKTATREPHRSAFLEFKQTLRY